MSLEQIQAYMEAAGVGKIKPSGDNLIGTCPFHEDTHRSFSVNVHTGQFCCFAGSCGEQGGLFAFLVKGCGYTAKKAQGIAEEYADSFEGKGTEAGWQTEFPAWADRRRSAETQEVIQEKLLGLYDFCPKYMRENRGFLKETLRRWEVGYDFETERVTFPVRDEDGHFIGLSKRTTKNEDPKYLHLGFKRSRVLYGEFFVPQAARRVWVAEGQIDALALWQMGVNYPVSTMSAKVGKRQIERLRRYAKVVLAYDADLDGRVATKKIGDALIEAGHREVYVARSYPEGVKDPGDLLQSEPEEVRRFIAALEPYDHVRLDWASSRW
jgi:putative DNA primase/helicase